MGMWVKLAINLALSGVVTLLQGAATSSDHHTKIASFVTAGQELLNNW